VGLVAEDATSKGRAAAANVVAVVVEERAAEGAESSWINAWTALTNA
jgi:hypothetical protein